MSEKIREIKIILLEQIYKNGIIQQFKLNLNKMFSKESKNNLKRAIDELGKEGKIKVSGMHLIDSDEFLLSFSGYITDLGILEYESYDFKNEDKFSIEIARFLNLINETASEQLESREIADELIILGSTKSKNILEGFLRHSIEYTCNVNKKSGIGVSGYDFMYVFDIFSAITEFGKNVLQKYNSFTNLFNQSYLTHIKDFILKEHDSLEIFIENKLWKDACIKMGFILEFLILKWLDMKSISTVSHSKSSPPHKNINTKDSSFFDKIQYYIEMGSKTYSNEIGNETEWRIVDNIIRDYRNFIHLQKYEENRLIHNQPLAKNEYEILYNTYSSIIQYF